MLMRGLVGFGFALAVCCGVAIAQHGDRAAHADHAHVDAMVDAHADPSGSRDAGKSDEPWDADLIGKQASITADGEQLRYTVTAGRMPMPDDAGKPRADVFFIAYTLDGAEARDRPVTFTFNGGPGSSSVWLHLGALGPRRVLFSEQGEPLPPPAQLVDNEHSWLDFTDMVFIDPVSTGFSRPAEGVDKSEFHGLEQDIRAVGEFVRLYTTRFERWGSPKFLCGESYGTLRAAGLAEHLQNQYGMYVNGITFVSTVLDFSTIRFGAGNDLPYILFFPSYAATAWYHGLVDGELEDVLRRAEEFARGDYALALLAGDAMPAREREAVVARYAELTGLDPDFVDGVRLRVTMGNFSKELLRDEKKTIGRFDSRYVGDDWTTAGTRHETDPSYSVIQGTYSEGINYYLRSELGYERDQPYEVLTGRVHPWDYSGAINGYVNVVPRLREAIVRNPSLHALFAGGHYDLATPPSAMDYTVDHLNLPEHLRGNISKSYYDAGHMMYLRLADLAKLHDDAEAMYERALSAEPPSRLGREDR